MRWESEEETERWFHHLEAAVRTPALSVREMLKDMALSTLVKLMTKRKHHKRWRGFLVHWLGKVRSLVEPGNPFFLEGLLVTYGLK